MSKLWDYIKFNLGMQFKAMIQYKLLMNIALLGGKFDPPHIGHLNIAKSLLKGGGNIVQVWFIPVNIHAWSSIIASSGDRVEMLELLIKDYNVKQKAEGKKASMLVSDIEIKRGGDTYTIDTVKQLKKHVGNRYYWVCGIDQLATIKKWRDFPKLQKEISFIVMPRLGYERVSLPHNFQYFKGKYKSTEYSSREIRGRLKKGLSIGELVSKKVEHYIIKKKLY